MVGADVACALLSYAPWFCLTLCHSWPKSGKARVTRQVLILSFSHRLPPVVMFAGGIMQAGCPLIDGNPGWVFIVWVS